VERARVWNSIGYVELFSNDRADLCLGKAVVSEIVYVNNQILLGIQGKEECVSSEMAVPLKNFFVNAP